MAALVKDVHEVVVVIVVEVEFEVMVVAMVVAKTTMVPPLPRKKLDNPKSIPLVMSTSLHPQRILFSTSGTPLFLLSLHFVLNTSTRSQPLQLFLPMQVLTVNNTNIQGQGQVHQHQHHHHHSPEYL